MDYGWVPRGLLGEARLVRSILGDDEAHGWPHVVRVARLSLDLASGFSGVDREALMAAVLYHDVGRPLERAARVHHAVVSARIAVARLKRAGWEPDRVRLVENAILAHSYSAARELGVRPESVEAMILSDADKLDALGAVGVARAILTGGSLGRSLCSTLDHLRSKILSLPELMYTERARRIAEERVKIVETFIESLEAEINCRRPSSP